LLLKGGKMDKKGNSRVGKGALIIALLLNLFLGANAILIGLLKNDLVSIVFNSLSIMLIIYVVTGISALIVSIIFIIKTFRE
jgi:uncharacterized membrane protein YuzA (DUF378 family)